MEELIPMICPICNEEILFEKASMPIEFTTDCCECNNLLIFKEGKLRCFHDYVNERKPNWTIN